MSALLAEPLTAWETPGNWASTKRVRREPAYSTLREVSEETTGPHRDSKISDVQGDVQALSKVNFVPVTVADQLLTPSQVIAEWHGQVVSIEEGYFVAELRGILGTGVAGEVEEAQIPVDSVQEHDLALMQPGAFFRLCVSMEIRNGTRRRFTDVVFRRLPAYRREELEAAQRDAQELVRGLRLE